MIGSPLTPEQTQLAERLLRTLTPEQCAWLGGYLAGWQAATVTIPVHPVTANALPDPAAPAGPDAAPTPPGPAVPTTPAAPEITVVYGSQTGNASGLARQLAERARAAGLAVTLHSLAEYEPRYLKAAQRLLVVTSTQGDGDPPDNAIAFSEFLHSRKAPRLPHLRYAVLALGDSSYARFCKTGQDLDERLRALGATPLHPRADCDLDYEEAAEAWMRAVLAVLTAEASATGETAGSPDAPPVSAAHPEAAGRPAVAGGSPLACAPGPAAAPAANGALGLPALATPAPAPVPNGLPYARSRPFPAEILDAVDLNGRGSARCTRHVELSLAGSGLTWEPGDSLGVVAENDAALVDELLAAADWDPRTPLADGNPLAEALRRRCEITVLTRPVLEKVAAISGSAPLADLLRPERETDLRAFMEGRDLVDLVRDFGLRGIPARECVGALRRLPPRLYSLASAASAYPDEPHITVRLVGYEAHGRARHGVCSAFLARRAAGETVPVFVQSNPNFRLPADPAAPLIMIGPGTGVAPFRAFLQERQEGGARGPSWLFFGDWRFRTDFLYQTDWQHWLQRGVLTRLDVAFSRDWPQKVYVQHRLLAHAREIYAWLEHGGCVYVCGDEKRMAPDVHAALRTIVMQQGARDHDQADAYLADLRRERRYQRDVY